MREPSTGRRYRRRASTTSKRRGRQRYERGEPGPQPLAPAESAPEVAPRGAVGRPSAARPEAPLAEHPRIAGRVRARGALEPQLELAQRQARRERPAGPGERPPQRREVRIVLGRSPPADERTRARESERGRCRPAGSRRAPSTDRRDRCHPSRPSRPLRRTPPGSPGPPSPASPGHRRHLPTADAASALDCESAGAIDGVGSNGTQPMVPTPDLDPRVRVEVAHAVLLRLGVVGARREAGRDARGYPEHPKHQRHRARELLAVADPVPEEERGSG